MPTWWDKRSTDAVSRMLVRIVLRRSGFMVEELKFKWNQSKSSTQFNSTKVLTTEQDLKTPKLRIHSSRIYSS